MLEEGTIVKLKYLMTCVRYNYKTLLDNGEWEAANAHQNQIIALRAKINFLMSQNKGLRKQKILTHSIAVGTSCQVSQIAEK